MNDLDRSEPDDLASRLGPVLAGLPGTDSVATPDGLELRRDGRLFAVVAGSSAEFRLNRAVAAAAARTPDAHPSQRGPGWIGFRPERLDRYSVDRAEAWLVSAWRTAGEGSGREAN